MSALDTAKGLKPLTKAEAIAIAEVIRNVPEFARDVYAAFERLLEAEAYWREAVKNAPHGVWNEEIQGRVCLFSAGIRHEEDCTDCPWLLSQ